MTTTESIQTMARRLDKAFSKGPEVADAVLAEIAARHDGDTVLAALDELQRRRDAEWAMVEAEHEAYKANHREIMRLFAACPEAKTAGEVCRIMAERGDAFAQSMQAWFDSREYRLESALTAAAAKLHPGWRPEADGSFTKLDPSAPEPPALVEWLYKTHPARAREIERLEGAP